MKYNFKSIRFKTWLYFLTLALGILVILGFLLVVIIKPYYRNNRIETINTISKSIESSLINKTVTNKEVEDTARLLVGNNVCALIYNEQNKIVYEVDSLGELCIFDEKINLGNEDIVINKDSKVLIDLLKNIQIFSYTPLSNITGS